MIEHPVPEKATIMLVMAFEGLGDEWENMSNGLKSAVLRLLLDRVIIWHEPVTIRVGLVWQGKSEQELIYRPRKKKRLLWTEAELEMIKL